MGPDVGSNNFGADGQQTDDKDSTTPTPDMIMGHIPIPEVEDLSLRSDVTQEHVGSNSFGADSRQTDNKDSTNGCQTDDEDSTNG